MVKSNEFKLGNYVEYNNIIVQISELHHAQCTIYSSDFYINMAVFYDEIKLIQITEELLLKIGFEKHNLLYFILNYRQVQIINSERGGFDLIIGHFFFRKIYFLHELQNIFFYLVGEELVFSSTES